MTHLLSEENSQLRFRTFPLAKGIREHLMKVLNGYKGDRTADGWKRLNNTLSADSISYDEMRRIKNFFDKYQGSKDNPEYILNGGEPMRTWVNNSLNTATTAIHDFKQAQKDAGIENAFIKPHGKNRGVAKPATKKVQTKNVHKSVGDNNAVRTENKKRPTVVITEAQLKYLQRRTLTEAAIISSADKLSQIPTFDERYKFCLKSYGEPIGKGSARAVFQITDDKVLKLAVNDDGLSQNLRESDYYNSVFDIFPLVYDADREGKWIISEYVLPAKEEDFQHCFGFDFDKFRYFIWACYAASEDAISPMKPAERNWLIEENNDLGLIDWYIQEEKPPMKDLINLNNYGLNSKNKIVLMDSELSSDIN